MALQYGSSEGMSSCARSSLELMAESGVRLRPDDLIVTAGAQQGLDLLAKVFIDPGDVVITEGPTYVGALQAFSAYAPTITVGADGRGRHAVDVLADATAPPRPARREVHLHDPELPEPRRRHDAAGAAAQAASSCRARVRHPRRRGRPVRPAALRGRAREAACARSDDEVIYLGTFSKIFAPGLRLGWMAAPRPILAKVLLAKQAADLCGSNFAQSVAEHYFNGTRWRKVLQGLTARVRRAARRDARGARGALPRRGDLDPPGGRLLRLGDSCPSSSTRRPCCPRRSSAA